MDGEGKGKSENKNNNDDYDTEPLDLTSDKEEKEKKAQDLSQDPPQGSSKTLKRNSQELCKGAPDTQLGPEDGASPEQKRCKSRLPYIRKYPIPEDSSDEEDTLVIDSGDDACVIESGDDQDDQVYQFKAKTEKAKRGPGRPYTTGQYIGVRQAREKLNKVKKEAIRLERELRLDRLAATEVLKKGPYRR